MGLLEIKFYEEDYKAFKKVKTSIDDFLAIVLKDRDYSDPDYGTFGKIKSLLLDNHTIHGGAPEIDDFELVDSSYDKSTFKGKAEIQYYVDHYYTCSDLNKSYEHAETWDFEIKTKESVIVFDIFDYEARSTFEEF
jgi:hypothetical protein